MPSVRFAFVWAMVLLSSVVASRAQPPSVRVYRPLAILPGEATTLHARGERLAEAPVLQLSEKARTTTEHADADSTRFLVECPSDAAIGVIGARVSSLQGANSWRLLMIDDLPSVEAIPDRNERGSAMALHPPIAVDATYRERTFDYYRIQGAAGAWVSVELVARRLGSEFDGVVRLLDDRGRQVAYSDDAPGLHGDARFRAQFPAAGEYLLEVRDVRYLGGDDRFYRLRVGDFPLLDVPLPPVVADAGPRPRTEATGEPRLGARQDRRQTTLSVASGEAGSGWSPIDVSDGVELIEIEPNDATESAGELPRRGGVSGRLLTPDDVDLYHFPAKQGDQFRFRGVARSLGSPADLFLRVLGADGQELASADDDGVDEGVLDFSAPAEGDYWLAVEELNHRAGLDCVYRIATGEPRPPFSVQVDSDAYTAPIGGVFEIKATATRHGYKGAIQLTVAGIEEAVVRGDTILEERDEATLRITIPESFAPGDLLNLAITAAAEVDGKTYETTATCQEALRARFAKLRYPPEDLARQIVVGVAEKYPSFLAASVETERLEAIQGAQEVRVKVTAARNSGFNGDVQASLVENARGVTAEPITIKQGQDAAEIALQLPRGLPVGEYPFALRASAEHRLQPGAATLEGLTLVVLPAVEVAAIETKPDESGAGASVRVDLKRRVAGPVALTWLKLPADAVAAEGEWEVADSADFAEFSIDLGRVRYWSGADLRGLLAATVQIDDRPVRAAVVEVDFTEAVRAVAAERVAAQQAAR